MFDKIYNRLNNKILYKKEKVYILIIKKLKFIKKVLK